MEQPDLTKNDHVILLLASHLGDDPNSSKTDGGLGPAGWHDLEAAISDSKLDSPGTLLELDAAEWPDDIWTSEASYEWVQERLGRSTNLAMQLEELNNRAIWVTTKVHETYPPRLIETLGRKAPPFLYITGEVAGLHSPAVGFVGSRDIDDNDRAYTRDLVAKVIDDGYGVVSGGARGIDETSEAAGLERGGPVIEYPAEGIKRCLQDTTVREAVRDGRLTLASHYDPEVSWNVGSAMGRNRLIHGFATYTVVVRSGDGSGGTWAGGTENLDNGWSPLLVCSSAEIPPGNKALIERGGISIDPTAIPEKESFEEWVNGRREAVATDRNDDDSTDGSPAQQSSLDWFR